LRSILGFFVTNGDGTVKLQLGHLGFVFNVITHSKQPGQAAANTPVEENLVLISSSLMSLVGGVRGGGGGDLFLVMVSFSALCKADLTLSRVQTLSH
jgi:hypothetical protein